MVAKFDAEGAHTVPFQQCIDEEIRILGTILDWSLEFWQLKMRSRLFEPGTVRFRASRVFEYVSM